MSDTDQVKRATQKSAAMTREGIERGTRAAEDGLQAVERSYSAAFDNVRELQRKLMEMARAQTQATFNFARDVTSAASPSDLMEIWTSHARKQFEMMSTQCKDLTELSQRLASETVQPITKAATQFPKK